LKVLFQELSRNYICSTEEELGDLILAEFIVDTIATGRDIYYYEPLIRKCAEGWRAERKLQAEIEGVTIGKLMPLDMFVSRVMLELLKSGGSLYSITLGPSCEDELRRRNARPVYDKTW